MEPKLKIKKQVPRGSSQQSALSCESCEQAEMEKIALSLVMRLVQKIARLLLDASALAEEAALLWSVPGNIRYCTPFLIAFLRRCLWKCSSKI